MWHSTGVMATPPPIPAKKRKQIFFCQSNFSSLYRQTIFMSANWFRACDPGFELGRRVGVLAFLPPKTWGPSLCSLWDIWIRVLGQIIEMLQDAGQVFGGWKKLAAGLGERSSASSGKTSLFKPKLKLKLPPDSFLSEKNTIFYNISFLEQKLRYFNIF